MLSAAIGCLMCSVRWPAENGSLRRALWYAMRAKEVPMDVTNEKRDGGETLVVLLRAEERAERAAEILESVEAMLERAAKTLPSPEREKVLAIAASLPDVVDQIETVVEAITDVGGSVEEASEAGGA